MIHISLCGVLCSDTNIEPLNPPAESKPGDRVYAEGYDNGNGDSVCIMCPLLSTVCCVVAVFVASYIWYRLNATSHPHAALLILHSNSNKKNATCIPLGQFKSNALTINQLQIIKYFYVYS